MTTNDLTNVVLDGIDTKDYPDFCDAFVVSAEWSDSETPLTDKELDKVNEDSGLVYELVLKRLF